MQNANALAELWSGGFDEPALQQWAGKLRARLGAPRVTLGLVFMSPDYFPHAQSVLEILRVHAQIPLLLGCSSTGLIVAKQEFEAQSGVAVALYSMPAAHLQATYITQEQIEQAKDPAFWHSQTGVSPDQINGWLAFLDPFHMDCEAWLRSWNDAYPGHPILGGLASGDPQEQRTQVYLNGEVHENGAVAVSFSGAVQIMGMISQGCTPIGETWTITKAEGNLIHEIGNRRAYDVLMDTYNSLSADEQKNTQGNLFVGLVINEYLEEFHRGDFLIRNLLGVDPRSGILAVGAFPRQGQTIQFQRRDAKAATEDLLEMLVRTKSELGKASVLGGCLCCCNGRGERLFGAAHHDAQLVAEQLGAPALAGFFCNGEIGPVGRRNFLHGYTASLALFVEKHSA